MQQVTIAGRTIGRDHRPYVIAELSANHNGSLERAMDIMRAAKKAGADALKLQSYRADTITIDHDGPDFRVKGGLWDGARLYDLYEQAAMPWDWHQPLFELGRELGIAVFSSPFDHTAVDMLEQLGAPAYKIASLELIDIPLIEYVARTGKPMIMSTGASELGEIAEAVAAARKAGCRELILLKCTSGYPTPPTESNLRTIPHLAEMFDCVVGLSDHTMGTAVPVAATALGSAVVEKHFTLARADGGVDSAFSLEPAELGQMIEAVNVAWDALGAVHYGPTASEAGIRPLRRSLYVVKDVKAGEKIGPEHVRSIRPGKGLAPKHLPEVIGRIAARDLARGTAVDWTMFAAN
ncbi:N-acetylneuraminate synthase [Dongia mobilis]|uniref:N-acetylneuraminate synthase n=1 Tax=Dongia mobilis TaxID=578943 RepID=A0A4R6WQP6_9PROT|nr:pseudaminic acid synthase [Dongia mobilis]TDQ80968.1 N-acetylneuraminate synthase [Dongia mobilis]